MAFVRAASSATDAPALAALQRKIWQDTYGHVPAIASALPADNDPLPWVTVLEDPQVTVLVAVDEGGIVGYCLFTIDGDHAEIHALEIDPPKRRSGHASRLLAAFADTSAPVTTAMMWYPIDAEPLRGFLQASGWGADGSLRDLAAADGSTIREVRMVTDLAAYRRWQKESGESPAPAG
jgi:GNAT superfamily N-acetyltransferase